MLRAAAVCSSRATAALQTRPHRPGRLSIPPCAVASPSTTTATTMGSSRSVWTERRSARTLLAAAGPSSQRRAATKMPAAYMYRSRNKNLLSAAVRPLSSDAGGGGGGADKGGKKPPPGGDQEEMSQEIVLTPGQKVVAGTRLTMWFGIFCFASACAYYIGKELLPSKMSPNSVFDKAFDVVRNNSEVTNRFGPPLKAYGRDHGGHREGRRNFIEHTEYTDKDDGSKRTRVRFNLEGKFGDAFVFAEVSSAMPSGEFVYVLVQDKRNGRVITVIDNRSAIRAQQLSGGSKEGMEAFSNLLTGGGKKD